MGLGISALVHVCLLWFLTLAPPPPVSRPADVPLEISVVTVEVPEAPDPLPEETGDASEPEPSAEPEPPVPVPASPVQPRETVSTEPELPPGEREPEVVAEEPARVAEAETPDAPAPEPASEPSTDGDASGRSEEHTSELQSREKLVCRLLLEKKFSYAYNNQRN